MFNIFASLAEFEKDLIRERTMAGLRSARVRGRMGALLHESCFDVSPLSPKYWFKRYA
jgi:hypothetical protein